jgi:hypothetical protein
MSGASWALQQAVFAVLSSNHDIRELVGERVFDAVPRGAAFPYIVIGETEETAAGTATGDASEHTLTVHIWSRGSGHREIKGAATAVRAALDGTPLALDGHTLVNFVFSSADFSRRSDGETYRAILRFRAVTEPQ